MAKAVVPATTVGAVTAASRLVESVLTSTSGRSAVASSFADAEMYQHNVEIDAIVRMECERLRAGLAQARKRQCQALVHAASAAAAAAHRLREKGVELEATHRRAAELEERLRQAAVENQVWCGLACSNEAIAVDLRATLDHLLLRAALAPAEGFGDSDPTSSPAAADDTQSRFFASKDMSKEDDAASSPAGKWACKCCSECEASVLPCWHMCLCKACEPKLDAYPICLTAKNASIHIAMN